MIRQVHGDHSTSRACIDVNVTLCTTAQGLQDNKDGNTNILTLPACDSSPAANLLQQFDLPCRTTEKLKGNSPPSPQVDAVFLEICLLQADQRLSWWLSAENILWTVIQGTQRAAQA